MSDHLPLLVVDKSYAQAVKATAWAELIKKYILVVPTAFHHEVFTTEATNRQFALTGFPEFRRIDLAKYLRRERRTGEPVTSVNTSELPICSFNPKVVPANWMPTESEAQVIRDHTEKNVNPSVDCWEEIIKEGGVPGFSKAELELATGSEEQFVTLCRELSKADRVRHIAAQISIPHASKLGPAWFYFRSVQARALQGLVLARRFKNATDKPSRLRLEHDLQDMDYLILGLITRNRATADASSKLSLASMAWRFKLLDPKGNLILPTPK